MEEKEIRQLFKNNFDCYADADNVIMAMTEDRFLEVVKQALHKSCVIKSDCEHPFAFVMSKCNGEINHCLKCGEHL